MTLERPIGEVAGDVGLVIDIRLSLAEKREELATEPQRGGANDVVICGHQVKAYGHVLAVMLGRDAER